MPATVIAGRIGWDRGLTVFKDRVRELRPAYLPPDPASRTAYAAGEIAQCDFWFPPVELPVGFGQARTARQLPVLTMVTGYSRWASAVLIPARQAENLFAGWWRLLAALGVSPAERITADRQAMLALPPVPPVTGWRQWARLARDHYIRLDSNDYSVHPAVIGRRIEVTAGLDRVTVTCEGRIAADHERI